MSTIAVIVALDPNTFKWRDRCGREHFLKDMSTTHLFYTLRMIWNHSMPADAQVGIDIKRYSFPPFYTHTYMMQACTLIFEELSTRTNLPVHLRKELTQMVLYFKRLP